ALMEQLGVTEKWRRLLPTLLPHEQDLTEKDLDTVLSKHLPKLGVNLRKRVKEALAIAVYRTQSAYPVTRLLLCDDAPQFNALTLQLALCWIHEFRHYKKLQPRFVHHLQLLQAFGKRFWQLYQGLLDYRGSPNPTQAAALEAEFDQLFTESSGYQPLDECKARTLQKREPLRRACFPIPKSYCTTIQQNWEPDSGSASAMSVCNHVPVRGLEPGIPLRRCLPLPTSLGCSCS